MKSIVVTLAVVLGVACLALAGFYWVTPAGALPHYLPGYTAGSTHVHFKHGLGMLILGLALFAFGWFRSGSK